VSIPAPPRPWGGPPRRSGGFQFPVHVHLVAQRAQALPPSDAPHLRSISPSATDRTASILEHRRRAVYRGPAAEPRLQALDVDAELAQPVGDLRGRSRRGRPPSRRKRQRDASAGFRPPRARSARRLGRGVASPPGRPAGLLQARPGLLVAQLADGAASTAGEPARDAWRTGRGGGPWRLSSMLLPPPVEDVAARPRSTSPARSTPIAVRIALGPWGGR
jgi:hypothetical protein